MRLQPGAELYYIIRMHTPEEIHDAFSTETTRVIHAFQRGEVSREVYLARLDAQLEADAALAAAYPEDALDVAVRVA